MSAYSVMKAAFPGDLVLCLVGDFYELYREDAITAARVLGLTLTEKAKEPVPMVGFPYHQLDAYTAKLLAEGHSVSVCEEMCVTRKWCREC